MRGTLFVTAAVLVASFGCSESDVTGGGGTGGQGGEGGTGADGGGGAGLPAEWACIGSVVYPMAPAATLDIERSYYTPSSMPLEGATIDVCAKDSDCATPLDSAVTDAMGVAALTLPTQGVGFDGYFRGTGVDLMALNQWVLPPIGDATSLWLAEEQMPVLFSVAEFQAFASTRGVTIEAGKGHVITTTLDCDGAFGEAPVTLDGGNPELTAKYDSVFFNVAPGDHTLEASLPDGTVMGVVTVTVVADELAAVMFGPTP